MHWNKLEYLQPHPRGIASNRAKSALSNLSSYAPSQPKLSMLDLRLNVNMGPAADAVKAICAMEHATGWVDHSEWEKARTCVIGSCRTPVKPHTTLLPEQQNAVRTLRNNCDIVVLPADKGNAIVVMDTAATPARCWTSFKRAAPTLFSNVTLHSRWCGNCRSS